MPRRILWKMPLMLILLIATIGLFSWWAIATRMLLRQDNEMFPPERTGLAAIREALAYVRDAYRGAIESGLLAGVVKAYVDYMRPDFHPSDQDNLHLAKAYLERATA